MGPAFLRVYYQCALKNASVIALVSVQESGDLDGFVVGFKDPKSFYTEFKSAKMRLLFPIALAMIKRPWLLIPSLSNVFKVNKESVNEISEMYTELVSIAVSELGSGVGSALLASFVEVSWADNVEKIILTTNRDDNHPVNQFYLKHGFRCVGLEYRNKRTLNKYLLERPGTMPEEKI